MALQFAITSSGTMIMQSAINLFGSTAVAAFTATGKLQSLLMQGMIAMGQTMATYSGQNFGYGDIKRIKAGVKTALWIALIYAVAVAALMCSLLKPSLHLFFSGDVDMATMLPWAQTYAYMCSMFFIPLSTYFHFPQYHAGLRLRFSADDGRCGRIICTTGGFCRCHEDLNFRLACLVILPHGSLLPCSPVFPICSLCATLSETKRQYRCQLKILLHIVIPQRGVSTQTEMIRSTLPKLIH